MIRRPPRSTLFPTRRSSDLDRREARRLRPAHPDDAEHGPPRPQPGGRWGLRRDEAADPRSEEHTSELQSRQYLVCRLLLEKKNETSPHLLLPALSSHPAVAQ